MVRAAARARMVHGERTAQARELVGWARLAQLVRTVRLAARARAGHEGRMAQAEEMASRLAETKRPVAAGKLVEPMAVRRTLRLAGGPRRSWSCCATGPQCAYRSRLAAAMAPTPW